MGKEDKIVQGETKSETQIFNALALFLCPQEALLGRERRLREASPMVLAGDIRG
jgi:hypothetical protein